MGKVTFHELSGHYSRPVVEIPVTYMPSSSPPSGLHQNQRNAKDNESRSWGSRRRFIELVLCRPRSSYQM